MSVNGSPNSAQPVETIYVDNHRVACDGGGGSLGHPKVWYEMGDEGKVPVLWPRLHQQGWSRCTLASLNNTEAFASVLARRAA
jgi:uncharacterized Zn-finger protein